MATVITIGSVDVTDDVYFARTNFVSQIGATPGTCTIAFKDGTLVKSFVSGSRILLTIDGINMWAGYLKKNARTYPFDAYAPPAVRDFKLGGAEIGILFAARSVYKLSNPKHYEIYPAHTSDTTVFADLFDEWIDLSGDDLDTSALVTHIGDINEDQPASPIVPGAAWGNTMMQMSKMLSPVWGINADREVFWADVDEETAPYGISDNPGSGEIGCSNLNIEFDGAEMINESLIIGTSGGGGGNRVVGHEVDAASIAEHGLWQFGAVDGGLWKQNSVNRVANVWVDGSPSSHRGHKDDKVTARCTIWESGIRPGMVVNLRSEVWDYDDNIPVRSMRISWPSPDAPRFDLLISHEFDTFSMFDPVPYPPMPGTSWPPPVWPPPPPPPPVIDEDECECGITDTFSRTVADWGVSDSGLPWARTGTGTTWTVDGSAGVAVWTSGGSYMTLPATLVSPIDITLRFKATGWTYGGSSGYANYRLGFVSSGGSFVRSIYLGPGSSGFSHPNGYIEHDVAGDQDFDWVPDQWYAIHLYYDGSTGELSFNIWEDGTTEPSGWMLTDAYGPGDSAISGGLRLDLVSKTISGSVTSYLDDLNIPGVDRCAAPQFDNFNRTVSGGGTWGTATPGGQVWSYGGPGIAAASVNGSGGVWAQDAGPFGTAGQSVQVTDAPSGVGSSDFSFLTRLKVTAATAAKQHTQFFGISDNTGLVIAEQGVGIMKNKLNVTGVDELSFLNTVGGTITAAISHPWTVGSWHYVRWEREGTTHRVRIWASGSPEPATWDIEETGVPVITATRFSVLTVSDSTAFNVWGVEYDFFDFADYGDRPCYYDDDEPIFGVSQTVSGWTCQNFDGGTNEFQLHRDIYPGTVELYVGGILQPQADVTVDEDFLVTLSWTPEVDEHVRICFELREL